MSTRGRRHSLLITAHYCSLLLITKLAKPSATDAATACAAGGDLRRLRVQRQDTQGQLVAQRRAGARPLLSLLAPIPPRPEVCNGSVTAM